MEKKEKSKAFYFSAFGKNSFFQDPPQKKLFPSSELILKSQKFSRGLFFQAKPLIQYSVLLVIL